jgi:hypothetical protein
VPRPEDLDALLAGLDELRELSPDDLTERLLALGLSVSRDEATGLRLMALTQDAPQGALGTVGLDAMLEQLKRQEEEIRALREQLQGLPVPEKHRGWWPWLRSKNES